MITANTAREKTENILLNKRKLFLQEQTELIKRVDARIREAIENGEYSIWIRINEKHHDDFRWWINSLGYFIYWGASDGGEDCLTISWKEANYSTNL